MIQPKTFLTFDTETGGFPSKKKALTDDTQPPLTQLGAILFTKERVIGELNMLLKVGDRKISSGASDINGHTPEICNEFGLDPLIAVGTFHEFVSKADMMVCHNHAFDTQLLEIEYSRAHLSRPLDIYRNKPSFCTMLKTIDLCKLPGRYGKFKWPKLTELHKFLFGFDFEGAHDAMADVRATMKCFLDDRVFPFK